jgi:hypothetical protein
MSVVVAPRFGAVHDGIRRLFVKPPQDCCMEACGFLQASAGYVDPSQRLSPLAVILQKTPAWQPQERMGDLCLPAKTISNGSNKAAHSKIKRPSPKE